MTFDRFDICAAYNMYWVLWGGDSYANAIGSRLSTIRYRPSHSEEYLQGLSENAKAIYGQLVRRRERLQVAYDRLRRRHPDVFIPWPGTRNIRHADPYRAIVRSLGIDPICLDMVCP